MVTTPELSIVVLTWNRLETLKSCINGIQTHTKIPHTLYVVNNGSIDGTREYLEGLEARGMLKAFNLDRNYGVTARNHAFKVVTTPFVAQVDDDVSMCVSWAEICFKAFNADPQLGIVCSQGAFVREWLSLEATQDELYVDCATGFFMMFRNLGLLYDESFAPFWHEELDFSFEFKLRGYGIRVLSGLSSHTCKRTTLDAGLERRNFEYVQEKWRDKIDSLHLVGLRNG